MVFEVFIALFIIVEKMIYKSVPHMMKLFESQKLVLITSFRLVKLDEFDKIR